MNISVSGELFQDLAVLLSKLGLSGGIIVDQLAFKLNGIDVSLEQPWINIVVDINKLPWIPKSPSIREISLVNHPKYQEYEDFHNKHHISLRLIPDSSEHIADLSYEFKLPSGEYLNVALPIKNILGFEKLIRKYIEKEKADKGSFSKTDVSRWIRNTKRVQDAATQRKDKALEEACKSCLEQLNILYQECEVD